MVIQDDLIFHSLTGWQLYSLYQIEYVHFQWLTGWLGIWVFLEEKKFNCVAFQSSVNWGLTGWLVIPGEKIRLCGCHLACWLVDLVVRGKNFQTVVAFHQLTYLFAASWNMCVRFFWLTGWLWILSKMTKLTTAWFTSPNIVCALSVVDWLTWDMSLFRTKKIQLCGLSKWC